MFIIQNCQYTFINDLPHAREKQFMMFDHMEVDLK